MKYITLFFALMTFGIGHAQDSVNPVYKPWSFYTDVISPVNPYFSSVSLGTMRSYNGHTAWDVEYKYFFASPNFFANSGDGLTGHGLHIGYKLDASGSQYGIHLSYDRIQLHTLEIASRLGGQYAQLMQLDRNVDQYKLQLSWSAFGHLDHSHRWFFEPFVRLGVMYRNTGWDVPEDINRVFEDLNWFEREPPQENLEVGSKIEICVQIGMRFGFGM